jgi:hypothetical protein
MAQPPPANQPKAEPAKTRLGRILDERPEARPRLARAVGGLLAVTLVTVAAIGVLLIWHLRRRAGLIRERLTPGCDLTLKDLEPLDLDLDDDDHLG